MHSWTFRLNAIFTFTVTVLAVLSALNALSVAFLNPVPTATIDNVQLQRLPGSGFVPLSLAPGPRLSWPHPPTAPPAPSVGNAGARARASTRAARTGAAPASPQCACECILYTDCRGGIAGPSDRTRRHGSCLT